MQADDAAHSPSEAQAEAELATGGDVDVDDGRHELVVSSGGGGGGGNGSGDPGGRDDRSDRGRDADDELHSYVGELVSCLRAFLVTALRPLPTGCGGHMLH